MSEKPKAFLYDIGNVLLRFDFSTFTDAVRGSASRPDSDVLNDIDKAKADLERGATDGPTFAREAIETTGFTGSDEEFIRHWQDIFTANDPMIDLIPALAANHPLYILSNTNDLHVEHILETFPVFKHFSGAVYSHEARCEKPDDSIYQHTIEKFGLVPGETIYIDDLPANAEAGVRNGFITHQYNPDDHAAFLAFLKNKGIETGAF